MRKDILSSLLLACIALHGFAQATGVPSAGTDEPRVYKLWYDEPAQVWTEALPLGNGRLGAMVYGTPAIENIQLNEETIWAGRPNNNANPNALEYIPKVRQLVFEGKYLEAQTLATEKVMAKTNSGVRYRRETITSLADQVVMVRLTASKPGMITCNAHLTSPHQDVLIASEGDEVTLSGVSSWHEGLKGKVLFQGRMAVRTQGGNTACADGVLTVEKADEATFYLSIATNFVNYKDITANEVERSRNYLHEALKHPYRESFLRHLDIYKGYMDRMDLDLGPDRHAGVTTDMRVQNFRETHDDFLVATYFRFGRYLLICSSQPDGQPANLQGIWNDKLFPSWDSKYTCNINVEMNYWPAEVTNLSELHQPLLKLVSEVSETGREPQPPLRRAASEKAARQPIGPAERGEPERDLSLRPPYKGGRKLYANREIKKELAIKEIYQKNNHNHEKDFITGDGCPDVHGRQRNGPKGPNVHSLGEWETDGLGRGQVLET